MGKVEIREKLTDFLSGNIKLNELSELIDNRLFELRQEPNLTDEQGLLSTLELIIHETEEGFRSSDELYATIIGAIEIHDSEKTATTFMLDTSASSEVNLLIIGANPVRDYRPEYQFA